MKDLLRYRIPGEASIEKEGAFLKIDGLEDVNGFIISDFLQKNVFRFEEGTQVSFNQESSKKPVVVSKTEYLQIGDNFLSELESKELKKAIFSRVKQLPVQRLKLEQLYQELCREYPNAFVYEVKSAQLGHWIGATPEVLLQGEMSQVETVALASTKRSDDNTSWNEKELEEQGLVADFVEDCLQDSNLVYTRSQRAEHLAGPVKHLINRFTISNLQDPVKLLKKLHPTPAVSGLPRKEAIQLIDKHEVHDRRLYTGFIGLIGEKYKLYVNLRCAQIIEDDMYIYVGGGYTRESIVDDEWDETENKAKTISRVVENL